MSNWISLSKITELLQSDWTWWKNSRCKYINLRIDMRDGHCTIKDRNGDPITLEQLQYQITKES